jgi:hypothetical protein
VWQAVFGQLPKAKSIRLREQIRRESSSSGTNDRCQNQPSAVRGLLIYCADYRCGRHIESVVIDARMSDLEPRFICSACGKRGADVRQISIG